MRWVHLCGSLNFLWHCLSLELEWNTDLFIPVICTRHCQSCVNKNSFLILSTRIVYKKLFSCLVTLYYSGISFPCNDFFTEFLSGSINRTSSSWIWWRVLWRTYSGVAFGSSVCPFNLFSFFPYFPFSINVVLVFPFPSWIIVLLSKSWLACISGM